MQFSHLSSSHWFQFVPAQYDTQNTSLFVCLSAYFKPRYRTLESWVSNGKLLMQKPQNFSSTFVKCTMFDLGTQMSLTKHYSVSDVKALLDTLRGKSFKNCPAKIPIFDIK